MKKHIILIQGVTEMLLFFIGRQKGFMPLLLAAMVLNLLAIVLNIAGEVKSDAER